MQLICTVHERKMPMHSCFFLSNFALPLKNDKEINVL